MCQKWTNARVQTTASVSSAASTHWAATDVPVSPGTSLQLTGAAVRVSEVTACNHNTTIYSSNKEHGHTGLCHNNLLQLLGISFFYYFFFFY